MSKALTSIVITFEQPINLLQEEEQILQDMVNNICDRYESEHPDRRMWLCGYGSRPLNMWTAEPDGPMEFDDACLSIECSEQER